MWRGCYRGALRGIDKIMVICKSHRSEDIYPVSCCSCVSRSGSLFWRNSCRYGSLSVCRLQLQQLPLVRFDGKVLVVRAPEEDAAACAALLASATADAAPKRHKTSRGKNTCRDERSPAAASLLPSSECSRSPAHSTPLWSPSSGVVECTASAVAVSSESNAGEIVLGYDTEHDPGYFFDLEDGCMPPLFYPDDSHLCSPSSSSVPSKNRPFSLYSPSAASISGTASSGAHSESPRCCPSNSSLQSQSQSSAYSATSVPSKKTSSHSPVSSSNPVPPSSSSGPLCGSSPCSTAHASVWAGVRRPASSSYPPRPPLALVQMATATVAVVWQLQQLGGLPQGLVELLQRQDIVKATQGAAAEACALCREYGFTPENFACIRSAAVAAGCAPHSRSLQALCGIFLRRNLDKRMQCSRWSSRQLSQQQLAYAATDAFVSREIYFRLRKALYQSVYSSSFFLRNASTRSGNNRHSCTASSSSQCSSPCTEAGSSRSYSDTNCRNDPSSCRSGRENGSRDEQMEESSHYTPRSTNDSSEMAVSHCCDQSRDRTACRGNLSVSENIKAGNAAAHSKFDNKVGYRSAASKLGGTGDSRLTPKTAESSFRCLNSRASAASCCFAGSTAAAGNAGGHREPTAPSSAWAASQAVMTASPLCDVDRTTAAVEHIGLCTTAESPSTPRCGENPSSGPDDADAFPSEVEALSAGGANSAWNAAAAGTPCSAAAATCPERKTYYHTLRSLCLSKGWKLRCSGMEGDRDGIRSILTIEGENFVPRSMPAAAPPAATMRGSATPASERGRGIGVKLAGSPSGGANAAGAGEVVAAEMIARAKGDSLLGTRAAPAHCRTRATPVRVGACSASERKNYAPSESRSANREFTVTARSARAHTTIRGAQEDAALELLLCLRQLHLSCLSHHANQKKEEASA